MVAGRERTSSCCVWASSSADMLQRQLVRLGFTYKRHAELATWSVLE